MNYSRLAASYYWIERLTIGPALQAARIGQLEQLSKCATVQNVLIVGEGDGSFLLHFLSIFPEAVVTVIEQSLGMITRAEQRLNQSSVDAGKVTFIHQNVFDSSLQPESYDLIVTLFFFDNFATHTLVKCIDQLRAAATSRANWLVSDFCIPTAGWKRWRARIWLKLLYAFFGFVASIPTRSLPEIERHMGCCCDQLARQRFCGEMLFSALYRMK